MRAVLRDDTELFKQSADNESFRRWLPTQWVALFPVSPQAEGFTLVLTNPNPKAGQPESALVDLGR